MSSGLHTYFPTYFPTYPTYPTYTKSRQALHGTEITTTGLAAFKVKTLQKVEELPNVGLLDSCRLVEVSYGKLVMMGTVASLAAEVGLRTECYWWPVAVQCGKAVPLWCEDILAPKGASEGEEKFKVSDEVCKRMNFARKNCKLVFDKSGMDSGDLIRQTTKANSAT